MRQSLLSAQARAVPRLAPQLVVTPVDSETLIVQSETRRSVLRGRLSADLLQAVDGQRCVQTLLDQLGPRHGVLQAAYGLDRLAQSGHVVAPPPDPRVGEAEAAYWAQLGQPDLPARQAGQRITLHRLGTGTPVQAVRQGLQSSGFVLGDPACEASADLQLLLCDDYLDPQVGPHLTQALRRGPVLLARLGGVQPLVGPLLDGSPGPCWHCIRHALAWNRPVQRLAERVSGQWPLLPAATSAVGLAQALGLLGSVLAQVLAGTGPWRRQILSWDAAALQTRLHPLRLRPQCPHCGAAHALHLQACRPLALRDVPVTFQAEGGYRSRTPAETVAAYRHLISPLTGVVSYLHPMPGRHGGSRKVYASGYPVCPQELGTGNGFDKVCAGKGQTDEQSQASALCEALERASSVCQGDEYVRHATQRELAGEVLPFDVLQGYSPAQYAARERINAQTTDRRQQVPQPWRDDVPIAWTRAWSLDGQARSAWVPAAYCWAEVPPDWGSDWGIYNPNGTAAGNHLEEAIFQGLLELVERDATALWWYNRLPRPALDLAVLADPYIQTLQREYAEGGWAFHVLDLTHDLGIPVYAAVAHHGALDRYAIGFGCHLEARLAVSRALTEMNQLLDSRADAPPPWNRQRLPDAPFLWPKGQTHQLAQLPSGQGLLQDIQTCCTRLAAVGLQAWVVDKTRPDIGLAVAQVIVPGLRHFWPRFGPGRLYEVPVRLGWRAEPLDEAGLNPAPLFL